MLDLLARQFLDEGSRVGIVAVDPTSPYTGGAVLGDRIRMNAVSNDPNCFVRSMATRGQLGGISRGAINAVDILDAAGYDYIFIETVGIGQSEIDIVNYADLVILVTVPGLGDDIQAFKAGIMEIGDFIVINKADHEEAQRTYKFIKSMISLKKGAKPEILLTDCINKRGIVEVKNELNRLLDYRMKTGEISKRRTEVETEELKRNLAHSIIEMALKSNLYENILHAIGQRSISPNRGAGLLIQNLCSQEGEHDK
jgi:LAO/AO transport system kinase